jgi:transposase
MIIQGRKIGEPEIDLIAGMMTRQEAEAIYDAGKETVVRVLLEMSAKLDRLTADFAALKAENIALSERVRTLEGRLAKDSHNSHKPPSSDGLSKPKPKSLRPKSDRPTGGQPGHPGHTLRMVETPDRIVPHRVECCAGCGSSLAGQQPDRIECRQVHDLPEPKLEVTEHQAEVKTCPCGCVNRAAFPPEASAPAQYGPRLKSVAVYLGEYQLLPFDRLTEIMRDLFACQSFSQGTLANFKADCSRRLEPVDGAIREMAADSPVVGVDETGMRATGSLHWLHTVSTRFLTWYYAHKRRGREAIDAAGILPDYQGRAVHDFLPAYLAYDCDHAWCNAHLLRELVFLWEQQGQKWAKSMIDHLLGIKEAVDTARLAGLDALGASDQQRFLQNYERIVEAGYAENPQAAPPGGPKPRGRPKQSKARNLLDRFRDHSEGILAFMGDFAVPFDNNQSERDLRMMKLREKISGTFRSFGALVNFCRIRGYVSTARKNGLDALQALQRVFLGNPFLPEIKNS